MSLPNLILTPTHFEGGGLLKFIGPWRWESQGRKRARLTEFEGAAWVWAVGGMGPSCGKVAAQLLEAQRFGRVVLAGFAGSLQPQLPYGEILVSRHFPDARVLSVSRPLSNPAEKRAAGQSTGAQLVEMELDSVLRATRAAQVPLVMVRAISDGCDERLPEAATLSYDFDRGQPSPGRMLWHLLTHPAQWAEFFHFAKMMQPLQADLGHAIIREMQQG